MNPPQVSGNVGAMCYDVGMNIRVEDAVQQATREHMAARQRWSVAHHREMSEQARARASIERTSR
jgi:putative salt-induced outer membrane protein YdiY